MHSSEESVPPGGGVDVQQATEGAHDEKLCEMNFKKLAQLRREEDWAKPPTLVPDPQQEEVRDQQGSRKRKREADDAGPRTVPLEQEVADMLEDDDELTRERWLAWLK